MLHRLLARQLKRLELDGQTPPSAEAWRALVGRISETYLESDRERYIMERSLNISSREMQGLYDRIAPLFERNPMPMFVFDTKTLEFLSVNQACVDLYGYTRTELLSLHLPDLRVDKTLPSALVSALEEGEYSGVVHHIRKDGTKFEAQLNSRFVRLGGRTARMAVVKDITQQRRLEDQLRQSQKMDAIGRLAGGVAHDFNNLLTVVLSFADMLIEDLPPTDPMRADLEEIRAAGQRGSALTRQLLLFSRQKPIDPTVVNLNHVLNSLHNMLLRILGEDIALHLVIDDALGAVNVDTGNMEQLVMNLVVNARDAMPTGGTLTIKTANILLDETHALATHRRGPHILLLVSDTGIGMDAATQACVFDPFFTTKEKGKGTGLGLSTVFGIVKQCDGDVTVSSEPGKGTAFAIYLPVVNRAPALPHAASTPVVERGRETILLVEDEDPVRMAARAILRRSGYQVLEACNAGEALLLCERHPGVIHLLLTDVVMPQMAGPELARRLMAIRPEMKVLCMSGYTDESAARHGVADGMAFLQKPLTPELLTRKLREVLDTAIRTGDRPKTP